MVQESQESVQKYQLPRNVQAHSAQLSADNKLRACDLPNLVITNPFKPLHSIIYMKEAEKVKQTHGLLNSLIKSQ